MRLTRKDVIELLNDRPQGYCKTLQDADLSGVNLSELDFSHLDLTGARLIGANLALANLYGACLRKAKLHEARMVHADLRKADLRSAELCFADLQYAAIAEADFTAADLTRVDMRNVSFAGVKSEQFKGAYLGYLLLSNSTVLVGGIHLARFFDRFIVNHRVMSAEDFAVWAEAESPQIRKAAKLLIGLAANRGG